MEPAAKKLAEHWPLHIPPFVLTSRVGRHGGFLVINRLLSTPVVEALLSEAWSRRADGARRTELAEPDTWEGRGGSPARRYRSTAGGEMQWLVFGNPQAADVLGQVTGLRVHATGGGTYSFYEEAGDYLGLHRDILTCDLAVITCLSDRGTEPGSGSLVAYPRHIHQPLSSVREERGAGGVRIPLAPGQTLAILGGIVPHEVTPTGAGQDRIVSVMCFRVDGWDSEDDSIGA